MVQYKHRNFHPKLYRNSYKTNSSKEIKKALRKGKLTVKVSTVSTLKLGNKISTLGS